MTLRTIDEAKNNNGVAVEVTNQSTGEGYVETNAIPPGSIVIPGSAANLVAYAGAGALNAMGWAYENTHATAETLRTNHTALALLRYERSPGSKFMGILDGSGTNITKGMGLKCGAAGILVANATADDPAAVVARYVGEATITTSATRGLVQWGV